jgi:hypothetical protein
MLTLKQLYARTDEERKQRATYVQIVAMKTGYTNEGLGYVAAKTFSRYKVGPDGKLKRNTVPNHYISMITFQNKKLQAVLSCSCDDNLFRWEVANSYKGASEIEYSNGAAPDTTNPNYRPGMCKHLVSLYLKIQPKLPPGH